MEERLALGEREWRAARPAAELGTRHGVLCISRRGQPALVGKRAAAFETGGGFRFGAARRMMVDSRRSGAEWGRMGWDEWDC